MEKRKPIFVLLICLLFFAIGAAGADLGSDSFILPKIKRAPDFTLVDQDGRSISLRDFRREIVIVTFVYSHCPGACPLVLRKLTELEAALRTRASMETPVRFLSISLDPERDTPQALRALAFDLKADLSKWSFLRGSSRETKKVLSDYDIWTKALPNGLIDHVMRVYLIDPSGQIREIYNLAFLQPELVLRDISMILRGQ